MGPMVLDPTDLAGLFASIVDIESVSRNERALADQVAEVLHGVEWLEVLRDGNTVLARTNQGRAERVVIAGHLDTVPVARNLPSHWEQTAEGPVLWGRGSVDMKGGIAVMLALATQLDHPNRDITWVFYEAEEIDTEFNGLTKALRDHPEWLAADLAVLLEPTNARIEAGCQGTMRFAVTTTGLASHSARPWKGHNAIDDMAEVLGIIRGFNAGEVQVDGLTYREGLSATMISGGVAGNVIPDRCTVQINYRFAPNKSPEQARALMTDLFQDYQTSVLDLSCGARPGVDRPATAQFIKAVGGDVLPKYGWTDVARFSSLGVPAVNFGPGDPGKAHADDEACPLAHLESCLAALTRWLTD